MNKADALGVFDSGVGGLTVVNALQKKLPNESIYYFADTLNLPYGSKKKSQIEDFSIQNCQFLLKQPVKALIIACHTASALAYDTLKRRFNVPIFDVLTPAVDEALLKSQNQKIAVLGTESTIHSNAYETRIKSINSDAEVISIACPLLVPIVEENMLEHRIASQLVKQYLDPILRSDVDTVILGCTHYPFLKALIEKEMGREVHIIDSAGACANQVQMFLEKNELCSTQKSAKPCQFFVSQKPQDFEDKGNKLFNRKISSVKKIDS